MKAMLHIITTGGLVALLVGCGQDNPHSNTRQTGLAPVQIVQGITPHQPEPSEHSEITRRTVASVSSHPGTNLYDIVYDNAPLLAVVREFSQLADAAIIAVPHELGGTVTVHLTGVHWKPALEAILGVHSFRLVEEIPGTGVYGVIKVPSGAPEPVFTEALFVNTADEAVEIAEAIQNIWGVKGSVQVAAIPSRMVVIIRARQAVHAEIKHILESIARENTKEPGPTKP